MFRRDLSSAFRSGKSWLQRSVRTRRLRMEELEDRRLLSGTPTVLSLLVPAATAAPGQPLSFLAEVRSTALGGSTPVGGTVTFQDGNETLGAAPLINGQAALVNSLDTLGAHAITAAYSGDAGDQPATAAIPQSIQVLSQASGLCSTFALPAHSAVTSDGMQPLTTSAPTGMTPTQIRQAYGTSSLVFGTHAADGTGTTIAIVDAYDDPNIAGDLTAFDTAFSLSAPPPWPAQAIRRSTATALRLPLRTSVM